MNLFSFKALCLGAFTTVACLTARGGAQDTALHPAPPGASPSILGLGHLALRASDIERTLVFYRDYLGLAERFRTDGVPGKPNVYYKRDQPPTPREGRLMLVDIRLGELHALELFSGRAAGEPVLHHVALRLADLEAARTKLERAGVKVPPAPAEGAPALKAFFVDNPSGQTLEVLPPAPAAKPRPPGPPEAGLCGIRFVVLPAPKSNENTPFYREALGLGEEFVAAVPNTESVLMNGNAAAPPRLFLSAQATEPYACIGVRDLDGFHARLQADAARLGFVPPPMPGHGPNRARFLELRDPDGFLVRLEESSPSHSTHTNANAAPEQ